MVSIDIEDINEEMPGNLIKIGPFPVSYINLQSQPHSDNFQVDIVKNVLLQSPHNYITDNWVHVINGSKCRKVKIPASRWYEWLKWR